MLDAPVTSLYAGLLALFYLYLTTRVIGQRRSERRAYGADESAPALLRATRAHANFQEYAVLFLLLLLLIEQDYHSSLLCHALALVFSLGRVAHAYSLLANEPRRLEQKARMGVVFRYRFVGMIATFASLGVMAALLLARYVLRAAA